MAINEEYNATNEDITDDNDANTNYNDNSTDNYNVVDIDTDLIDNDVINDTITEDEDTIIIDDETLGDTSTDNDIETITDTSNSINLSDIIATAKAVTKSNKTNDTTIVRQYATSISQTSGKYNDTLVYRQFDHLEYLKTNSPYATARISGYNYNGTKASSISLKGFGFNIPNDVKDINITIGYTSKKVSIESVNNTPKYPNIGAPTFTILNDPSITRTGFTVPTVGTEHHIYLKNISRDLINSSDFGVKIDFPVNTGYYHGNLLLANIYVEVSYTSVALSVTGNRITNNDICIGGFFSIQFNIENVEKISNITSSNSVISFNNKYLKYIGVTSGVGSITDNSSDSDSVTDILVWDTILTNYKSNITLKFKALMTTTTSTPLTITNANGNSYNIPITILKEKIGFSSSIPNQINEDVSTTFIITTQTTNPDKQTNIRIKLPISIDIENTPTLTNDYNCTFTHDTNYRYIDYPVTDYTNGINNLTIQITPNTNGTFTNDIILDNKTVYTKQFKVKSKDYENLSYCMIELSPKIIDRMADSIKYTLLTTANIDVDATKTLNPDITALENYRFGVFNNDPSMFDTYHTFIDNTTFSSNEVLNTNRALYSVDFVYNSDYPVYVIWTNTYMENDLYGSVNTYFTEPQLIETGMYNGKPLKWGIYPYPLKNVITPKKNGQIDITTNESINPFRISGISSTILNSIQNLVLTGLQITFEYTASSECQLLIYLRTGRVSDNDQHIGIESIRLFKGSHLATIGGKLDLFGLTPDNFSGNLDSLEVEFVINNPYNPTTNLNIGSLGWKFYYMSVEKSKYGFGICDTIGGEITRCESYGAFVTDLSMDIGTDNTVTYYTNAGTDTTLASRSNINKKSISIQFNIGTDDCDFIDTNILTEKMSRLMNNDRDNYNKPIMKYIIFDHIPDYAFGFIREDPITPTENYGTYNCKATLVIPDGTGYCLNPTITGGIGENNGIARVKPSIACIASQDGSITLTENVTKNVLTITSTSIKKGNTIIIDCDNRTVTLLNYSTTGTILSTKDITDSVNFSSSWIILEKQYNITGGTTCIIQSVEYRERYT